MEHLPNKKLNFGIKEIQILSWGKAGLLGKLQRVMALLMDFTEKIPDFSRGHATDAGPAIRMVSGSAWRRLRRDLYAARAPLLRT